MIFTLFYTFVFLQIPNPRGFRPFSCPEVFFLPGGFSCPGPFPCPEPFPCPGRNPGVRTGKNGRETAKKRRKKAKKSGGRSQLSPPSRRIRKGGGETLPPHLAAAGRIPHGIRAPGPDRNAKIGILAEKAAPRGGKRRSGAARPLNRRFPSGRRWRSRS